MKFLTKEECEIVECWDVGADGADGKFQLEIAYQLERIANILNTLQDRIAK